MAKRSATVVAAWIAGAFAVVGPIATYFATHLAETHFFQEIPAEQHAAIEGQWKGFAQQDFRGHPVRYPAELELKVNGRKIEGRLHVDLKDGEQEYTPTFEISGGFVHERFLRFDYASNLKGSVHFGSMILELSADTTTLRGHFVAFGAYSQTIVDGTLDFRR